MEEALAEYLEAQKERDERGFDANTFSIYWLLRRADVEDAAAVAREIDGAFDQFPNYRENPAERRDLKAPRSIDCNIKKAGKEHRAPLADQLLTLRRR